MNNFYNAHYAPLKTPEQINQEYNQIMQQYQNMYRNINPAITPNNNFNPNYTPPTTTQNAVSVAGDYRIVEKYSEVENTPTRLDGTASLFFDFDNMVFWSKKFVNGQHAIQSYKFMPINNNTDVNIASVEEPAAENKPKSELEGVLTEILARLKALEEKQTKTNKNTKKIEGDLVQ